MNDPLADGIPSMSRLLALALVLASAPLVAQESGERVDLDVVNRIRNEGLHRSQVMATARQLTDVIGPRLTGSPALKIAGEWTKAYLAGLGADARLEAWGPFGRGWTFERCAVHMVRPHATPLVAYPQAWTPGTQGPVRGLAIRAAIAGEEDFEKFAGKLAGRIVLASEAEDVAKDAAEAPFERRDPEDLASLSEFPIPTEDRARGRGRGGRGRPRGEGRPGGDFRRKLREFLRTEGVLAVLEPSGFDHGVVLAQGGGPRESGEDPGVPTLVLSAEHYNWILRLLEGEAEVELEVDVATTFHDEDLMAYNTVADFAGDDLAREVVMAGGHLDSWHTGTGATDNAAGCAVVLEAVRILRAIGVKPRRTIRVALWTGEEQGLLGSRAWIAEHLAKRTGEGEDRGPLLLAPEHETISAYFNLDNGSGRIRGVYCQENVAVRPIFEAWLEPFHDLGATTATLRNTGGTDHLSFDAVGVPGFQFVQDELDYSSRTHHTHVDTYDHLVREDLMQASMVMASFLYHAANRAERLPRKPLPE